MRGRSESHLKAQLFRLERWSNITYFCERPVKITTIWSTSLAMYSLVVRYTREESGKDGRNIGELEKMDASEVHTRRLNAKEVLTPMKGEKFIFPIADGIVKPSEGEQVLRTSTLIRDRPDRGEEQVNLQGESDGSSSSPLRDSSWYDSEARNDFGLNQSQTVRAKRSIIPYSTEMYRRDQGTNESSDVMMEKNDDYWNVDGDRELSDAWTGFTRFTVLDETPLDGKTFSVEGETYEETNNLKTRRIMARNVETHVWRIKTERETKVDKRKPKLDNARRLRGICVFDLDDVEFKDIIKNARRKLEVPMPAAMPCKLQHGQYRKTCRTL